MGHSIAAMVDACRQDPASVGMVTALGWYATKHSVGVYSTTPPADGFRAVDPADTQSRGRRAAPPRARRPRRRDGRRWRRRRSRSTATARPTIGILSVLLADGRRALANCVDADPLLAMCDDAWEGRTVTLRAEGDTNLLVT